MKTTLSFLTILLFSHLLLAQTTAIPDANFEQALIDLGYDTGTLDGKVPTANINTVTGLWIYNRGISNLTGIEDFSKLEILSCYDNSLTSIDVSKNTALYILWCQRNSLSHLDVRNGNNTKMEVLRAEGNPKLFCISVDDSLYSVNNWTNLKFSKDSWTHYSNGSCETNTSSITVENMRLNISIFPNPSNDYIVVKGIKEDFKQMNIYDVTGKLLIHQTLSSANQQMINITSLVAGNYFIHLEKKNGESYVFKMVK